MNLKVYNKLIETAKANTVITYSQLNTECGLKLNFDMAKDRNIMGDILGEISHHEFKAGRPLLSALVIEKKVPFFPSHGFFKLAKELKYKPHETDISFWAKELTEIYKEWK